MTLRLKVVALRAFKGRRIATLEIPDAAYPTNENCMDSIHVEVGEETQLGSEFMVSIAPVGANVSLRAV